MRPYQSLLFLVFVGVAVLALGALFPENLKLGDLEIRLFRWQDLVPEKVVPSARASQSRLQQLDQNTQSLVEADSLDFGNADSTQADTSLAPGEVPAFALDSNSHIQYPGGDSTVLYSFFDRLDSARNSGQGPLRILHIGDSQIEGDRITGYLRQRLQQQFGGCGPGMVPLSEELASRQNLSISSQPMPEKYVLYGKPRLAAHGRYSVLHSLFQLPADSGESYRTGRFTYQLNRLGYSRNRFFNRAGFLFRNARSNVLVQMGASETDKIKSEFAAADSFRMAIFESDQFQKRLNLKVGTSGNPDLYGICLDCHNGVAVDNIPLRGSSGLEFVKINARYLQEQVRKLNVGMVILQFGVNVVPYESPSYGWYENALVRTIQTLKAARPGLQVLVIGVSDMAHKKDGQWQSWETIPMVLQAQKNACRRTQSAFWNLYEVMGGQNSILAWAQTEPPLVGKDYIHLTPRGAQVIGEYFFQALNKEIIQRKKSQAPL